MPECQFANGSQREMKVTAVYPVIVLGLVSSLARGGQLVNGGFETGDLTGWTLFNTALGGTALADVVSFDTAHTGAPSQSARFEVGETSGGIGGGGLGQGAGIFQDVSLLAGQLNIALN